MSQSFVDETRLFDRCHFIPLLEHARQLERENADLRADIERHVKIASEQATELADLRTKLEAAQRDAACFQWGVKNARWIRHEHEAYVAIPVARDADLSCVMTRLLAIDAAMQEGK